MKKPAALALVLLLALPLAGARAEEERGTGMDWQISILPQQTPEEKEAARWTEVMENSVGKYFLAQDSIFLTRGPFGDKDRNILQAEIKTVFVNPQIKKQLDEKIFAPLLKKGDSVESCKQKLQFNLRAGQYRELYSTVYAKSGAVLKEGEGKKQWKPMPPHSIAEAVLEILKQIPPSQLKEEGEE